MSHISREEEVTFTKKVYVSVFICEYCKAELIVPEMLYANTDIKRNQELRPWIEIAVHNEEPSEASFPRCDFCSKNCAIKWLSSNESNILQVSLLSENNRVSRADE